MEVVGKKRYRNGKGRKTPVPERKRSKKSGTGMERVGKKPTVIRGAHTQLRVVFWYPPAILATQEKTVIFGGLLS